MQCRYEKKISNPAAFSNIWTTTANREVKIKQNIQVTRHIFCFFFFIIIMAAVSLALLWGGLLAGLGFLILQYVKSLQYIKGHKNPGTPLPLLGMLLVQTSASPDCHAQKSPMASVILCSKDPWTNIEKQISVIFMLRRGNYVSFWQLLYLKWIMGPINLVCYGSSGLSTWNYQFSYDHWSQATLSLVSTWMGNCSSVAWVLLLTLKVG